MAATAAVSGLASRVRALGPCLPSKFRLEVEMQYLPAGILSSFIPRQAEQPGWRSWKPAASKTLSMPSSMACCSTCLLPGTIHTSTWSAFFLAFYEGGDHAEVFDAGVGATADKDIIHFFAFDGGAGLQAHIVRVILGSSPAAGICPLTLMPMPGLVP